MKQYNKKVRREPRPNINEYIRATAVEVIDKDGKMLGVMQTSDAVALARKYSLDLCVINEKSPHPLCKMMDYSKHKYLQSKRSRAAKKQHQIIEIKGVKFRINIGRHDYTTKIKHCCKFLSSGKKVKVDLFFRGREIAHQQLGLELFDQIKNDVAELGEVDSKPSLNGKNLSMLIAPIRKK